MTSPSLQHQPATRTPHQVFADHYRGQANLITPEVVARGEFQPLTGDKLYWELSRGSGIDRDTTIHALTTLREDRGTISVHADLCKVIAVTKRGERWPGVMEVNDILNEHT